jgi:hypothetical protein
MTLILAALALSALGAGEWSLDNAIDLDWTAKTGLLVGGIGIVGALLLLAVFWRRPPATEG